MTQPAYFPAEAQPLSRLDAFRHDALRSISFAYLMWLILASGACLVVYSLWGDDPLNAVLPSLFLYYLISAIHVIYRLSRGGRANILAPDIIFLLFYTVFHLGYVTLFGLNLVPYTEKIFFYESSIPQSLLVVNIGQIGFLFGYELWRSSSSGPSLLTPSIRPTNWWCVFGSSLILLAMIIHLGVLSTLSVSFLQKHGYEGIQNIGRYKGYLIGLMAALNGILIILGVSIYLISSALRYGKLFQSKFTMGIVITFFVLYILEGDRGSVLLIGVPILLVRHYFIKRIRIRYLIAIGLTMLILFTAVRVVRTTVLNPSKMLAEYRYRRSTGEVMWMSPFLEMGGSFLTVDITCHDVPSQEPFWLGASWIGATTHLIPFLQGFAASHGWIRWTPGIWITTTYFGSDAAGRAFTVAAEGYLNFGYVGAFVELFFFGLFVRWITVKFSRKPSAAWAFMMLGCMGPTIMVIRNSINTVVHQMAYVFVLGILLNMFLGNESGREQEGDYRLNPLRHEFV